LKYFTVGVPTIFSGRCAGTVTTAVPQL